MKILKYFFFLLLIVFIAGSIYVATKNGSYQVEESHVFQVPPVLIYEEVTDYQTWPQWSWLNDSETEIFLGDTTTGTGAALSWQNSPRLEDGSLQTTSTEAYSGVVQQLLFDAGLTDITSEMYWSLDPVEQGTRVTWGIRGTQNFKEKLSFTLRGDEIDELFRPILSSDLERLESQLRTKMEAYTINVNGVTRFGGGFYMYTTAAARLSEIPKRGAEMLEQVNAFMEENDISVNGNPFLIYHERDNQNGTAIFSAAIPTTSQVVPPAGSSVLNGYLPSQRVVKTTLRGNHKNSRQAWEEGNRYIHENDLSLDPQGEAFEIFITDPLEEVNPALWVTEIYLPIQ